VADGVKPEQARYLRVLTAPVEVAAAELHGPTHACGLPLAEVLAARWSLAEVRTHLTGAALAAVADERAIRGERSAWSGSFPGDLGAWEPAYALARFGPDGVRAPRPAGAPPGTVRAARLGRPGEEIGDPYLVEAVRGLAAGWCEPGAARAVATEGRAADAVAALAPSGVTIGLERLDRATAIAELAWVGAAGAGGRVRRGAALGRRLAWEFLAALAGRTEDWPLAADDLDAATSSLRWWRWHPDAAEAAGATGRAVRLVVEDLDEELSWAVEFPAPGA
jgi:hypothetical protein